MEITTKFNIGDTVIHTTGGVPTLKITGMEADELGAYYLVTPADGCEQRYEVTSFDRRYEKVLDPKSYAGRRKVVRNLSRTQLEAIVLDLIACTHNGHQLLHRPPSSSSPGSRPGWMTTLPIRQCFGDNKAVS